MDTQDFIAISKSLYGEKYQIAIAKAFGKSYNIIQSYKLGRRRITKNFANEVYYHVALKKYEQFAYILESCKLSRGFLWELRQLAIDNNSDDILRLLKNYENFNKYIEIKVLPKLGDWSDESDLAIKQHLINIFIQNGYDAVLVS